MDYQKIKIPLKEYLISISDGLFEEVHVDICNCIDLKHITFKVKLNENCIPNNIDLHFWVNQKFLKDIQVFFKMICPKCSGYFNFVFLNYPIEYFF